MIYHSQCVSLYCCALLEIISSMQFECLTFHFSVFLMTASYFFGHVTVWYGEKTYVYACVSALEGVSCEEDKRQ